MARPKKNNADYFSHDKDMRDDRKIKALRSKFGILGYGIWCMMLEYLTGANNNEMPDDELEIELVSGDFGVSVTEMNDIVNYCVTIKLLCRENGLIYSKSLKDRLAPVYEKRERAKRSYRQKATENDVSNDKNNSSGIVSVTETTQSKVKERKVKYITIYIKGEEFLVDEKYSSIMEQMLSDQVWLEQAICMNLKLSPTEASDFIKQFFVLRTNEGNIAVPDLRECKQHFANWVRIQKHEQQKQKGGNNGSAARFAKNGADVKPAEKAPKDYSGSF